MAGLLKEIRDLPTAVSVTEGLGDYLHIKQGDVDRKITVAAVLEPHTSILSGNPHNVTKAEVGLGLVTNELQLVAANNLGDVTNVQDSRDNLNIYSKPEVDAAVNGHASLVNNPHNVTKSQVGLSAVNNYGISDSANLNSSTSYASSKAVKTVFDLIDNADISNQVFKSGMIMMWHSPVAPTGWTLCNGGQTSTGITTPNMIDRFPVGAGNAYGFNTQGGTNNNNHNHSFTGHNTTLDWSHIPPHQHAGWGENQRAATFGQASVYGRGHLGSAASDFDNYLHLTSSRIFLGGSYRDSAAGHSHGGSVNTTNLDNRPPYTGVYFIMKD